IPRLRILLLRISSLLVVLRLAKGEESSYATPL
ncbi:hypothetical protein A2U01_0036335, partial [Trifolium medium]|nr:hypothetical protein [Trifolium medium]